jgi:hypothetical protein
LIAKDELIENRKTLGVRAQRRKSGVHINIAILACLRKETARRQQWQPRSTIFVTGEATPKGAEHARFRATWFNETELVHRQ